MKINQILEHVQILKPKVDKKAFSLAQIKNTQKARILKIQDHSVEEPKDGRD